MSPSDGVARALAGDRTALDALWREHRRVIATVLLAHMPRTAELDDLLQEVAVVFVQRLADLRDPARLPGWLRSVAVNVARTAARRRQARPVAADLDGVDVPDPAVERRVRVEEARGELQHVLNCALTLPADEREPLLLRALHGWGQRAIAELLDVPETTVESRLARARRALRRRMADDTPLVASPEQAAAVARLLSGAHE